MLLPPRKQHLLMVVCTRHFCTTSWLCLSHGLVLGLGAKWVMALQRCPAAQRGTAALAAPACRWLFCYHLVSLNQCSVGRRTPPHPPLVLSSVVWTNPGQSHNTTSRAACCSVPHHNIRTIYWINELIMICCLHASLLLLRMWPAPCLSFTRQHFCVAAACMDAP